MAAKKKKPEIVENLSEQFRCQLHLRWNWKASMQSNFSRMSFFWRVFGLIFIKSNCWSVIHLPIVKWTPSFVEFKWTIDGLGRVIFHFSCCWLHYRNVTHFRINHPYFGLLTRCRHGQGCGYGGCVCRRGTCHRSGRGRLQRWRGIHAHPAGGLNGRRIHIGMIGGDATAWQDTNQFGLVVCKVLLGSHPIPIRLTLFHTSKCVGGKA